MESGARKGCESTTDESAEDWYGEVEAADAEADRWTAGTEDAAAAARAAASGEGRTELVEVGGAGKPMPNGCVADTPAPN